MCAVDCIIELYVQVISYIILEEAEYKLRDAISSKERYVILPGCAMQSCMYRKQLEQEISMAQVTEVRSL